MMQLTWKASEPASAIYAATCLSRGLPVADVRLAEAFAPAVDMLLAEFAACTAPADRLLPLLTGLASRGVDDNRQLVEQALTKLFGRLGDRSPLSASVGRLAGAIAGVKVAYQTAYGKAAGDSRPLVDELALRSRPLVEQWESRGPGLLLQLARSTEEIVLVANAEIALVYPFVGGHGMAHHQLNCVTFEAVLTNPVESLPEVMRLSWLLAQLNVDLPMYSDHVSAARRDAVGQLALVPAVLAAAEYVELTHLSAETIGKTLAAWRVNAVTRAEPVSTQSETLLNWWNTYQQGETPWAVALGALEQMLFAGADQS
jgi:hypothetical protein